MKKTHLFTLPKHAYHEEIARRRELENQPNFDEADLLKIMKVNTSQNCFGIQAVEQSFVRIKNTDAEFVRILSNKSKITIFISYLTIFYSFS